MKNDESNGRVNGKDKQKSNNTKYLEINTDDEKNSKGNLYKSPKDSNPLSPVSKEYKITLNNEALSSQFTNGKFITTNLNNIPQLPINSIINQKQSNLPTNNINNDKIYSKNNINNGFSSNVGSGKSTKNLTHETFTSLFKLNDDLNIYANTNNSNHMKTLETLGNTSMKNRNSKSIAQHTTHNKNFNSSNNSIFKKFLSKKNYVKTEDFNLIPLDQYSNLLTETMANYRTESIPVDNNVERENEYYQNVKSSMNKTLIGKSLNNLNITYGENSFIKIDVKDKEYKNPKDAIKILNTNRNIFDNISTSLINIQKMYYDKTISGIEKFHEFKRKMCKVRVSNIIPKNTDILSLFKTKGSLLENSNLMYGNNQINEEMPAIISNKERTFESVERERIREKEKEKEREKEREREKRRNKKKKEEIKLKNKIIRPDEMELYSYYKYSSKNFPEGREQFAFDYNLTDLVLFGGIVTNKNNNVWTLDPITLEWEKKNTDNIPPYPRYGHSGIIYQKKLYIFGGKCKSNNYHYIADLDIFDLTENQWFTPNSSSKTVLELRRNHVADLIGQQMIIHGGMNEENKVLSDCYILTFSPLKWTAVNVSEFTPSPALCSHASAVVLPIEMRYNARTSIYKFPENGFGKLSSNRMREKGWYLFGGINSDDGTISNDLWILRLGRKPLEWIRPNTRGKTPQPRYSHTLNYYEEGNFLILHGGRNDLTSQSFALNDTHIFELSKMEWQEIKLFSDIENFTVFNRCGHSAVVFSNKLIIFGGMNNLNYLGSSLLTINLDFNYKFQKEIEHENSFENGNKNKNMGSSGYINNKKKNKKGESFDQGVNQVTLPPIK